VTETRRLINQLMGLNEFTLGIWIPGLLKTYDEPKGIDENASKEYRKCMIGNGTTNEGFVRNWTEDASNHLSQFVEVLVDGLDGFGLKSGRGWSGLTDRYRRVMRLILR